LFVDHTNFALYDIEDQRKVALAAFSTPKTADPAFQTAVAELSEYFSNLRIPQFEAISREVMSRAVLDLKGNSLVDTYLETADITKKGIMTGSIPGKSTPSITDLSETTTNDTQPTIASNPIKTSTRAKLEELLSKPIPEGMSYEYRIKYTIPVYFAFGEDTVVEWFGMTDTTITSDKAIERVEKIRYELKRLKKQIRAGIIKAPKQQFQPNRHECSPSLRDELYRITAGTRANQERLVGIIDYMIRCAKEAEGDIFFRGYNSILADNRELFESRKTEHDKLKAVSEVLGIFCEGLLTDSKTGKPKSTFGVFRVVERGRTGERGKATSWELCPDYVYLLDL